MFTRSFVGSMVLGAAIGAVVCTIYPLPLPTGDVRKLKRGIGRSAKRAYHAAMRMM